MYEALLKYSNRAHTSISLGNLISHAAKEAQLSTKGVVPLNVFVLYYTNPEDIAAVELCLNYILSC